MSRRVAWRRILRLGLGLGAVVAWLVVILPMWLLNTAVRIDVLASGAGWQERDAETRPSRSFKPESRPAGQVGRRSLRVLAVGLLLTCAAVSTIHRSTTTLPPTMTPFGPRSAVRPADGVQRDDWARYGDVRVSRHTFPNEPWGTEVLEYQEAAPLNGPDQRYGWRNIDLSSHWVNVVEGRRVTLEADSPELTVWLFGGSTIYGIGQRDGHTIASDLVREARRNGRSIEVVNFGVAGYVNWQETRVFADALRAGGRPDVALFVDGVNDLALGFEREVYGLLDVTTPLSLGATEDQQEELRAAAGARGWIETHDPGRQARLAAAQYRQGVRHAREVARESGVPVLHFWQPQLSTLPVDRPGVSTVLNNLHAAPGSLRRGARTVREAASLSGVGPIDLTHVFDRVSGPVFFDWAHTNEAGAAIMAAALYESLDRALRSVT